MKTFPIFRALAILILIAVNLPHNISAQQVEPPFAAGQVVIAGAPADLPAGLNALKYLPHANLTVAAAPRGGERALAARLRQHGRRADVNLIAHAFATVNDPIYSFQWHFPLVQAEAAWDTTSGSTNVVVAVLDTGLATAGARDGIGCVVAGRDVVNNDNSPVDGDGHGTHVAGTISQRSQNGVGLAGLAYGACIMPVKVLDDSGAGTSADIADGIYFAVNNGAEVINMSLGWSARYNIRNNSLIDPALNHAFANNVTVVCASGNDGSRKNVGYPAIYPTTISVGATDARNQLTRYSNKGDGLDLVAPGGDNSRDDNDDNYADGVLQETRINGSWGYYFFDGTSMASPHVAAAAALLISSGVATTPQAILDALTTSALDLGSPGYDKDFGHGLLQVANALGASPPCTDDDSDGYCAETDDCNDGNAAINPGTAEVCGDGIDNNCDGAADEGCGVCTDADNDGYCAETDDCNDGNAAINPGTAEVCGDGVDNNCDGAVDEGCGTCTDADGDGVCVEDGDCDDTDAHIYPGHPDKGGRWGRDGLDNDCNGVIDG